MTAHTEGGCTHEWCMTVDREGGCAQEWFMTVHSQVAVHLHGV